VWHYRDIAHYLAGIITALSYFLSPVLPFLGLGLFIVYKLYQHWQFRHRAYHDILEFTIAFSFCFVALTIMGVL